MYPGSYRITPLGFVPGYYLESVRIGERDVTAADVDITPATPPVRVIYKPNAGRVRGAVEHGEGVGVVLVPRDEAFMNSQFIRSAVCGRGGSFEVGSLRPGEYYAFAFERPFERNAFEDPAFVRSLANRAVTVGVSPGESASVNLRVTPWPE